MRSIQSGSDQGVYYPPLYLLLRFQRVLDLEDVLQMFRLVCPNGRPCQCGCLLAIFDRKRQVELAHLLLWLVATVVLAYYLLVLLIASGFLDIDRINYYTDPQYCIILRVSFETFRCPSRSKPFFSNTLCLYLIATMQFGRVITAQK